MSRVTVRRLDPYVPGTSIEEVRRRFNLERVIKLASNENPLGSSPKALAAIADIRDLHLYDDDSRTRLREKIAARYKLGARNVVLGHGSNELVNVACQTLLEPGDEAVMATPSFSLYRLAVRLQGARAVEVPLREGVHDLDAMLAAITAHTKAIFVCDPNNPTGTAVSAVAWKRFVESLPERVTLIVDRAYSEYMTSPGFDAEALALSRPQSLVLRTMSKIYGLASLRFGYGLGGEMLIGWLQRVRLPFNVSRPAALGAGTALDDHAFVQRSIDCNERGKEYLGAAFARLGLETFATQANFFAVRVPVAAARAYEDLLRCGIIVRSGDGLRFPGWLRITIGSEAENRALVEALESLVPQWRATG